MAKIKKTFFIAISTILVTGFVYFSDHNFNFAPASLAGAVDNLSGFAWSENIGWISFNSTNCDIDGNGSDGTLGCPPVGSPVFNYGVSIDSATGNLSGYAWSENIGWIMFNPTGPYPSAPNNSAKLDIVMNITGWARACAGTVNGDCVSATRTDGWDGWIKMAGTASNGSAYGVTRSSGANCGLSGFAWGSDVVGWIQFQGVATNGSPYGVKLPSCGVCGAADGVSSVAVPAAADLCLATTITPTVVGGGGSDWTWWCSGADGTTSADDDSCSAPSPPVACTPTTGAWGACLCPDEIKWRTNIGADCSSLPPEQGECTAPEKNSCRDFNWREVAP